MGWKEELFRCFFVAFGMLELITNIGYLKLKNGLTRAIKHHGELPRGVSEKQIKVKVLCMLISGAVFLIAGLFSFYNKSVNRNIYISVLSSFSIYAVCEALYYKYWKTVGFATISILLTLLFIFL